MTQTEPKYTQAEVEAMLKNNTWWPFTRVDARVLEKVHRAMTPKNHKAIIPTNPQEEALL